MFQINRLAAISEIELLIKELFSRKHIEKCSIAIYKEVLDMAVSILNSSYLEKLVDRVDHEFRLRDLPFNLRMCLFDYVFHLVSSIRFDAIQKRIPRYVKYTVELSPYAGVVVTDRVIIDFEATFLAMHENVATTDDVSINPSIEDLADAYEKIKGD